MKVVVVYGCSCSGKSTYVKENIQKNDIVYDYDRLLTAMTYKDERRIDKHAAHNVILSVREKIIANIKDMSVDGTVYLITRYPTNYFKKSLEGLEVSYHFVRATKKECLDRLEHDVTRLDKKGWKKIIDEWFSQYNHELRSCSFMKEVRICEIRAEAPAGSDSLIISGLPIVYDKPTIINDPAGSYTEVIRSGALDSTDLSDARLLYNHDLNKVPLARTPKTMQLMRSAAGLSMIANLPETEEAKSVYTAVERGDLSGMSFAFKVPKGGDLWNRETRTREILKIEKVYEISIVPFPAYPQTSVEARSMVQEINGGKKNAAIIKCNQILSKI